MHADQSRSSSTWTASISSTRPRTRPTPRARATWHGGPDLSRGYCVSSVAFCDGAGTDEELRTYDGSGMAAGPLTLFVELQDNLHRPLGPTAQVEVRLLDPHRPVRWRVSRPCAPLRRCRRARRWRPGSRRCGARRGSSAPPGW
ncbi:MAG: hypothetical protein R3F59_34010 [Myxococcota bacterium]